MESPNNGRGSASTRPLLLPSETSIARQEWATSSWVISQRVSMEIPKVSGNCQGYNLLSTNWWLSPYCWRQHLHITLNMEKLSLESHQSLAYQIEAESNPSPLYQGWFSLFLNPGLFGFFFPSLLFSVPVCFLKREWMREHGVRWVKKLGGFERSRREEKIWSEYTVWKFLENEDVSKHPLLFECCI